MVWLPSDIGTPRIQNKTKTSVTVIWGSSRNDADLYELYWDKNIPGKFEKLD